MAISKITLNGVTQIDLTSDTVTASKLFDDYTAHGADGTVVTGSYVAPTARTSTDVTVSGDTVTIPAGAYSTQVQKSVASGTAGTPTASKGAVNNHSIAVTPSVTNSTGYITGSTINGTAVTVSASELVSGDKSITQNGSNIDVADYSTVTVNVSGGGGTVKLGALRPDAELVQSWSYDKLYVQDLENTIPAYSTSQSTLLASADLSPTKIVYMADYDYLLTQRILTMPIYSSSATGTGRFEYELNASVIEYVHYRDTEFLDGIVSTSTGTSTAYFNSYRLVYWSSSSLSSSSSSTKYGIYSTPVTSGLPNTTATYGTFTAKSPVFYIRGSSTYLNQTYWELMTDIRLQYVIELWRVPKTATPFGGFAWKSQVNHIIECARSQTRTLT